MTQLYIGNLSAEADEKTVRAVFGKYGVIRDTVMKNGYAFLAFDNPMSADAAVKEMNGECCVKHHNRTVLLVCILYYQPLSANF